AREIDYSKGEIRALTYLGIVKFQQVGLEEGIPIFNQALEIAKSEGELKLQIEILSILGQIKMGSSFQLSSINDLMEAEALGHKLPDKSLLSSIQGSISSYYVVVQTDLPLAMEWAFKSQNTTNAMECTECLESAWVQIGTIYSMIGDQEQSLLHFQKAMKSMEDRGEEKSKKSPDRCVGLSGADYYFGGSTAPKQQAKAKSQCLVESAKTRNRFQGAGAGPAEGGFATLV